MPQATASRPIRQPLARICEQTQERLDELMRRNNDGALMADEREEFAALVDLAEDLSLANARTLARLAAAPQATCAS